MPPLLRRYTLKKLAIRGDFRVLAILGGHSRRFFRRAFTMIELLLGVVIFSLAMLPLFSLGISSNRGAYSVGKHMMAGQMAQSIMDRYLNLTFAESITASKLAEKQGETNLLNEEIIGDAISKVSDESVGGNMNVLFKNFKYKVDVTEASGKEKDEMFLITVKVSWQVAEGQESSRQYLVIRAIKHKEYQ